MILLALFWFIQFTDKLGSAPIQFSDRATENRIKWNIPTDSLDYAVVPAYVDSVRNQGARVCYVSRWLNGCTINADSATIEKIAQLPMVQYIEQTRNEVVPSASVAARKFGYNNTDADPYQDNGRQLDVYNLRPLHEKGFEGQGIRIAVIDAGFHNVDIASCFKSTRLIGVYDFSADATSIFGPEGQHGANCLSFIAAQTPTYHGAATQAEFVLIRTEENTAESPKECDNLIAAYELCDSLGVNVITCSLGYRLFDDPLFNFTHNMLDGRTVRVSRAATIAARKGILLCQSAGNDGNKSWHKISIPSDADSILTVGALDADSVMGAFSSYGPSADGRIKPEISAVGVQAVYWNTGNNKVAKGNGTSYSTPLLAGLAASLWSALPDATAMEIRQRIIESAHLYPNYDTAHQMGYGIPNALKAYLSQPASLNRLTDAKPQPCTKIMQNGQLYILRNGDCYTLTGNKKI